MVIPTQGREYVLRELHGGHPGMSRMKAIARTLVWWPRMDQDIEGMVRRCEECQTQQASPPHAPLHPWKWPTRPWARLHVDFAGPMWGRMLLVVIDAHSKWIEVEDMNEATAGATIQRLRAMFARFGIPESLVSDNGPCFISKEFKDFLRKNGVMHITSAPYHPASNGLAERAVRIVKEGLRKMKTGTISDKIARLLFQYRMTPQSVIKLSPAELLLGRCLRGRLNMLHPNLADRVEKAAEKQKEYHDVHAKERKLQVGNKVYVKVYERGGKWKWKKGEIVKCTGPVSFIVQLEGGIVCRRHLDQLRELLEEQNENQWDWAENINIGPEVMSDQGQENNEQTEGGESTKTVPEEPRVVEAHGNVNVGSEAEGEVTDEAGGKLEIQPKKYPSRVRQPPDRYGW